VRFWDASAVVPLILEQPASDRTWELLGEDPEVVVWWGTSVECASALARLRRDGALSDRNEMAAMADLDTLASGWHEMVPTDPLRAQARRVLRLHPLRAADGLQLAAALEWAGSPVTGSLVTLDGRLATAAVREGFSVIGP
jgi:predicted nucleic acid-binding protein